MRTLLALPLGAILGYCSPTVANPEESWTPSVEFNLEDADRAQTLTWVSGWSYALTAVGREQMIDSRHRMFCLPDGGNIESRIMLDALNKQFRGERVTSEQAAAVLWTTVKAHYVCSPL